VWAPEKVIFKGGKPNPPGIKLSPIKKALIKSHHKANYLTIDTLDHYWKYKELQIDFKVII